MPKLYMLFLALMINVVYAGSLRAQSMAKPLWQDSAARQLPDRWSLQDCLDYAIKNNITINKLRLSQRSAGEDLLLSKSGVLPNLGASVNENLTFQKGINTGGGYGSRKFTEGGNYGLNSSVILYQGGYLKNSIREKHYLVQVAELDILQEENDITLNVTQGFLNILLAMENIIYLQDLVNTSLAQVKQAQQKYDAGSIALKDLAQLKAQYANDKYSLVTAQNAHRQNIISLKQILQLPSSTNFVVREPETLIAKALVTLRTGLPLCRESPRPISISESWSFGMASFFLTTKWQKRLKFA